MKKQIFALLLSLLLVVSLPFSALADVASGSNAVYGDPFSDRLDMYSSVGSVVNTVRGDLSASVFFYNPDTGKQEGYSVPCTFRDNQYHIKTTLSNTGYITYMEIQVRGKALPPSGSYYVSFDFSSDFSYDYHEFKYWWTKYTNSASDVSDTILPSHRQLSGDLYSAPFLVNLTNVAAFNPVIVFKGDNVRNISGSFSLNFTPAASDPSAPSTGLDTSQQDYESGVSSSLSDIQSSVGNMSSDLSEAAQSLEYISQSQNLIIKGIDNIILHISDQLYAFWDQLYNLIHVPTMAKLDQILQAIKDMDINVNVDLDELKSAISSAASKITGQIQSSINSQITNDDKNTEHLENGYDNSGILGDKGKLDGAITEYEKVEDQLISDAKDKIGKFEFDNPFEKYTGPLSDISYFLTGIYNGLQGLNIPVSFSLTLTIALVFIGYYRFKGGA